MPYVNNIADGIFFIEDVDFVKAFSNFDISFFSKNWVLNWLEVVTDDGTWKEFTFTVPNDNYTAWIGIEFYNQQMYSIGCKWLNTTGTFLLYKNNTLINNIAISDYVN